MCVQVQALLRVSKTNFVVMKLLVGGHKKDSVVSGGWGVDPSVTLSLLCYSTCFVKGRWGWVNFLVTHWSCLACFLISVSAP